MKNILMMILTAALTANLFAQNLPPAARVENVTDEYFGVKITDPYRWMEDLKADETQKWMKGQADYADGYLKKLPMREEIFKRLTEVSSASDAVSGIRQRGNLFFYQKRGANDEDFKLYVREGLNGTERLLVDPNKVMNDGKRYSFAGWSVSFDGKYVSYNIAAGGSEQAEIHVIEVATGKDMGERIERTNYGSGAWMPDGKSFLYPRLRKLPEDSPAVEKYRQIKVYRHVLGTNPDTDKAVFGYGVNDEIKVGEDIIADIGTDKDSKMAYALLTTGVSPEIALYVAPIEDLMKDAPIKWRKIAGYEDEVSNWSEKGDDIYLMTFKNSPRYKIVRTSLSKPDLKTAETVFSGGEAVVQNALAQPDALYVQTLDGGNVRIHRVDYKTKKAAPLEIPYEGAANLNTTAASMDGIYYSIISWTKSSAHFKYDPKTKKSMPTNLIPPNPVDMSGVEFVNAKAKSHDGVMIPLVIIYKKGLKLDGKNPTLMNGYGAYGSENVSPFFFTGALPWLERGGIYVFAGVRGGGEYGEEWHLAGKQKTKPNTWKDFIACAEYLIREKYTSPQHLGIQGGSAGGVLISNSITTRPDLFGAAIINVGLNNTMRAELTANGVPNVPEFGSFKTEEGFKSLLEMDGFHKVKDGTKYPAVLLTHGVNDPRVEPWMSLKMAARLQAATSSGKPVLMRLDYDAGHGIGSTKEQRNRENADTFAFLFEQLK